MFKIKPTATVTSPHVQFVRYVSKNKIPVQLHKDFPGLGLRGEVVRVLPGRMRNQLHPYNGASYVLKDKPLKIELLTRQEALEEKKRRAIAEKLAEPVVEEKVVEQDEVDYSDLAFLNFPAQSITESETSSSANSSADPFSLHTALDSLPSIVNVQRRTKESGFLEHNYTAFNMSEKLTRLIGFQVSPLSIRFEIKTSPTSSVQVEALDHVGEYNMTISISATNNVTRKLRLTPTNSNLNITRQRPYEAPLPRVVETKKEETSTEEKEAKNENSEKEFPWQNDFISQLENRYKK